MKRSRIAMSVFLLMAALCPAQQTKIIIRLLNGKSGKPIRDGSVNVWLGNGGMSLIDTDRKGEIELDVADVQPHELRVNPNTRFDCRFRRDFSRGDQIKYSLDEIVSKGIVAENVCGKIAASTSPGVLILFVRPKTFWEMFMI